MESYDQPQLSGIEAEYAQATEKRSLYLTLSIALILLSPVGYVFNGMLLEGVAMPTPQEWLYFPLNFATYGIIGVALIAVIFVIIRSIKYFISSIMTFGIIVGALDGALKGFGFFALAVGIPIGLIEVLYSSFDWQNLFSNWGIASFFYRPIPGISETLGAALVASILYDIPFIFCIIKAVFYCQKSTRLKNPAHEAQAQREAEALRREEERLRQKQARKLQKEREQREHQELERRLLNQLRQQDCIREEKSNGLGEFGFFDGCKTLEEATETFESLMRVYSDTNPTLAAVISDQYQEIQNKLSC